MSRRNWNPGYLGFFFGGRTQLLFSSKLAHLLCGWLFILHTFSTAFASSSNVTTTKKSNCPEKLPCYCDPIEGGTALKITCNSIEPYKVWEMLDGFSHPLDVIAINNCPNGSRELGSVPKLKLRSLQISMCSLEIQPTAFDILSNSLEELWLFGCSMTAVPKLGKLKRLQRLNLNSNKIREIPDLTFLGLKELRTLWLRNNQIYSLVNPFLDQKLSLELLDLSKNLLAAVPSTAIRGCQQLKFLSLADNGMDGIHPMQFMSLPKLEELRLHGNKLRRVPPNGFMYVTALKMLFLHNNLLTSIDEGTLQTFKGLRLVDLSSNLFPKIPSFKDMAELEEVRLDNNSFQSIDTLTFNANPKLKIISLAQNKIETIARNSFDSLDNLQFLNLADNELTVIEKGMLEGMRHLKDLILRNNSLAELNRHSFTSVPQLTNLDLAHNELSILRAGTFASLQNLHILRLDNNQIEAIEKGTFENKVDTIWLDGNKLRCDQQLDWFIEWLVRNKVRTFVPRQPDIKCASPEEKRGTRLKDLMIQKNNITAAVFTSLHNVPGLTRGSDNSNAAAAANLLTNLLPGISRSAHGHQVGQQVLSSLTQSFPEIRQMPGMNFLPDTILPDPSQPAKANIGKLDTAIDQFSQPLVKFASGAQPSPADVSKLLSSIPSLVVNIPGFGNVDISKLNPSLVKHVLEGGQIPGIPRETMNNIVRQYMQRLYVAAAEAQGIPTTEFPPLPAGKNASKMLRPLSELPHQLVQNVMEGKSLPHLTNEQTQVIRDYYTQRAPVGQLLPTVEGSQNGTMNVTGFLSPKVVQMMQLLPRNYNLSQLPPELVRQVMRGEMPDLTLLPLDLQQYIKDNFDRMILSLENTPDLDINEILNKLPRFEQPKLSTFSPYDINKVDSNLVVSDRKSAENARFWRIFSACVLGLAGAITLGVLSAFCFYWRRTRAIDRINANIPGIGDYSPAGQSVLPSMCPEHSSFTFRPSASSTLKSNQ